MSLRTTSTRKLVVAGVVVVAAGLGGVAIARAGGSGPTPPDEPLANAVHDALAAQHPAGVTARVQFSDSLIPGGTLGTSSPLLSGASGRLWVGDGSARLELQTNQGDTEIGIDHGSVTVYDAASNTAYHATLPQHQDSTTTSTDQTQTVPTVQQISDAIARLAQHADISGATPVNIAGEPAYQVRISPSHSGGLLGAAELAWDAANGVPLRAAIYASGTSTPVLELTVTDVSFGPVSASDLAVNVPQDAKTTELKAPADTGQPAQSGTTDQTPVEGVAAVQAKVGFPLAAPDTLVGLPRQMVRLVQAGNQPGALIVYGQGLGAIAVYERAAQAQTGTAATDSPLAQLPSVSINGATGHELATALGTGVEVDRSGVSYLIAGSIPASAAEAAARELLP
jgi:hypothetical protein